jgi:hypothetical protein
MLGDPPLSQPKMLMPPDCNVAATVRALLMRENAH